MDKPFRIAVPSPRFLEATERSVERSKRSEDGTQLTTFLCRQLPDSFRTCSLGTERQLVPRSTPLVRDLWNAPAKLGAALHGCAPKATWNAGESERAQGSRDGRPRRSRIEHDTFLGRTSASLTEESRNTLQRKDLDMTWPDYGRMSRLWKHA